MLMIAQIHPVVVGLLVALFVLVSVMMMLVVLIQKPQGGGLTEAFGAASGSGNTAFGAKTGDALTYATIIMFVLFVGFAIGLNYIVKPPAPAAAIIEANPTAPTPSGGTAPDGSVQVTPAPSGDAAAVEPQEAAPITEPVPSTEPSTPATPTGDAPQPEPAPQSSP